jgi:hypothetical protein
VAREFSPHEIPLGNGSLDATECVYCVF